jgi:inner membrane protein
MAWGAFAQSLPDIDFISAFWNNPASNLLAHRGFTHSVFFALLAVFFISFFAEQYHKTHRFGFTRWTLFFAIEIGVHLFIDLFNSYGVGLLEPFSHQRFSFNAIFVADPFFSIWPAIGFTALLLLGSRDKRRKIWWRVGVIGSSVYLLYCTVNKIMINSDVAFILKKEKISASRYFTTPTPLNNWLWFVVAEKDSGYYIGYRSVFDKQKQLSLQYFPKYDFLLQHIRKQPEVEKLKIFSQGYYTVEKWNDTLVFNDLRFGQIIGWYNPHEKFVFHYYLNQPGSNQLVVQRGRFAKWNHETTGALLKRIRGS